jgi:exopolyphosphatase / guanosine-5'-triphosphate,3'-diphosphate pyrophosphatase
MGTRGRVAAIDCGTNSTRLLIVEPTGAAALREMRITRLGQGVDATHRLAPDAVIRTLEVLQAYRAQLDAFGVERTRLVATSAVRDAQNGRDFLARADAVIGVEAELLTGQEEGRLAYLGAASDLEPGDGTTLVVDIGGGSTELVLEVGSEILAVSMDVGCVRVSERALEHDPPMSEEVERAVRLIDDELDRAELHIDALGKLAPDSRLIGLAGTVSTLMALELGLAEYDRSLIHHNTLSLAAVERWCDTLGGEPADQRARRRGMLDGRQDVILGGALVLRQVMSRFRLHQCLVSESDILDGLAMSLQQA